MPKMIISKQMYSKVKKVKRSKDYICLLFLNIPTGCKRKVEGIFCYQNSILFCIMFDKKNDKGSKQNI